MKLLYQMLFALVNILACAGSRIPAKGGQANKGFNSFALHSIKKFCYAEFLYTVLGAGFEPA